ncbi:MAG: hypothetical protein WAO35_14045 [Terriglobia bacterium]
MPIFIEAMKDGIDNPVHAVGKIDFPGALHDPVVTAAAHRFTGIF